MSETLGYIKYKYNYDFNALQIVQSNELISILIIDYMKTNRIRIDMFYDKSVCLCCLSIECKHIVDTSCRPGQLYCRATAVYNAHVAYESTKDGSFQVLKTIYEETRYRHYGDSVGICS